MNTGNLVKIKKTGKIGIYINSLDGYPHEKIIFVEGEERIFFEYELEVIDVQSK